MIYVSWHPDEERKRLVPSNCERKTPASTRFYLFRGGLLSTQSSASVFTHVHMWELPRGASPDFCSSSSSSVCRFHAAPQCLKLHDTTASVSESSHLGTINYRVCAFSCSYSKTTQVRSYRPSADLSWETQARHQTLVLNCILKGRFAQMTLVVSGYPASLRSNCPCSEVSAST